MHHHENGMSEEIISHSSRDNVHTTFRSKNLSFIIVTEDPHDLVTILHDLFCAAALSFAAVVLLCNDKFNFSK